MTAKRICSDHPSQLAISIWYIKLCGMSSASPPAGLSTCLGKHSLLFQIWQAYLTVYL